MPATSDGSAALELGERRRRVVAAPELGGREDVERELTRRRDALDLELAQRPLARAIAASRVSSQTMTFAIIES